jgi:hypothetical protein
VAFGFVDFTLCRYNVWVGGQLDQWSGWLLSAVSTIVAIVLIVDQWDFLC